VKRVYPIERYCMACGLCRIGCAVAHSKSGHVLKFRRESPRPKPRTSVPEVDSVSFSLMCRHCDDAPCLEACITGAMHRDERGAIVVDQNKCIGCWMCIMVCPYGVIERELEGRKVASKCDLCAEREVPACVEWCPNRALVYEER